MPTKDTSITSGQKRKIGTFVSDAVEKVLEELGVDSDGAQRIIEVNGAEFCAEMRRAAQVAVKKYSVSIQYANEEAESSYTYPKEYKGPHPIEEQIAAIAKIFGLDPTQALAYAKKLPALASFVPADALEYTGWFAVPSVSALAKKHFADVADPAEQYCRALQLVHEKIAASRAFYNYREGKITPAHLRMHARTAHALDLIAETQPGDILIIAAQLGKRHGNPKARSVRRAREVFVENEYGLGSLIVGSIVLTHPERLVRWEELDMDCPGDEFSPEADGDFYKASSLVFNRGKVEFGTRDVGFVYQGYGSTSGFLPQQ